MKRILTVLSILLAGTASAQAQEARVIGKIATPFDAQIYAFLDGDIGKHFSYSVSTHFVNGNSTGDLYRDIWKSSTNNWCDWAYMTYSIGGFSISAGKDMILNGLYEFSPCDIDNYSLLCSSTWNGLAPYQIGATARYDIKPIGTTVLLQFSASPFDERPFQGHHTISLGLQGDFGVFQPYYAVNRITMDEGKDNLERLYLMTLGNRFQINDEFLFHLDYLGKFSPNSNPASSILCGLEYSFLESLKLTARGGWETSKGNILKALEYGNEGFFAGLAFEFRPVKFLRLHTAGSYNQSLGTRYEFGASLDFNFGK